MCLIKTTLTIVVFHLTYSTGKKLFCEILDQQPLQNRSICVIKDLYLKNFHGNLEINDKHYRPNDEHDDLEMRFESCELNDLPKGLFVYYSTISKLEIQNGKLEEIGFNKFENAKNLKQLDLSRNNIRNLIDGQFSGSDLTYLCLAYNQIETIPYNLFDDLHNLTEIDLSNNNIDGIHFSIKNISISLKILNLRSNKISFISQFWMSQIIYLKFLDISGNELEFLFSSNTILETIYLEHNKLTEFRSIGHGNLKILNLSFNKLEKFIVEDIDKLKSLDLSFNRITDFEKITPFNIMYLNLQFSGIKPTDFHILKKLKHLRAIDISNNQLEKLDLNDFKENREILRLFLNGNNLTEINYEIIHSIFPRLKLIYIHNNNWNCSFLERFINYLNHWNIHTMMHQNSILKHKNRNKINIEGVLCNRTEDQIQLDSNDKKLDPNETLKERYFKKFTFDKDDVIGDNELCTDDDHFNLKEFVTWLVILIGYIWVGYKIILWFMVERNKRNKYFQFCGL